MHGNFRALSVSYKKAQLQIREQVALSDTECRSLLVQAREVLGLRELLVISTCNRTELYYNHPQILDQELIGLLSVVKGIRSSEIAPYFQYFSDQDSAVLHLFHVSLGLESQVVGDLQIINQVKKAYQISVEMEMAGPFLHRLLHTIFYANKRTVQETAFRDGAASVSYAAYETIIEAVQEFRDPKIVLLGVGEIGTDVAKQLMNKGFKDVVVINRTLSKAQELAAQCGFRVAEFEQLWEELSDAHVVVSSVSSSKPVLTYQKVKSLPIAYCLTVLDLAVPRSVEPGVEKIPGVDLYNIDEINHRTSETVSRRMAAIPQVVGIIEEVFAEFKTWSEEIAFSPLIQKIKDSLESMRQRKIAKFVKQLDENELKKVDAITRELMNDILGKHVTELKSACQRGNAEQIASVLQGLFDIEQQPTSAIIS